MSEKTQEIDQASKANQMDDVQGVSMSPPPFQLQASPAAPPAESDLHSSTGAAAQLMQAPEFASGTGNKSSDECLSCNGRSAEKAAAVSSNVTQRMGKCHGTNRIGNLKRRGVAEHILIQQDYISTVNPMTEMEYAIPGSSAAGNTGYADIVDPVSKGIYEIKHVSVSGSAVSEVARYVAMAKVHCDSAAPWHPGLVYPKKVLPYTDPTKELVAHLKVPGVIEYWTRKKRSERQAQEAPQSVSVTKQVIELAKKIVSDGLDAATATEDWLKENPDIALTIVGIGTLAIIALLADDTTGVGVADDVLIPVVWTITRTAAKFAF